MNKTIKDLGKKPIMNAVRSQFKMAVRYCGASVQPPTGHSCSLLQDTPAASCRIPLLKQFNLTFNFINFTNFQLY